MLLMCCFRESSKKSKDEDQEGVYSKKKGKDIKCPSKSNLEVGPEEDSANWNPCSSLLSGGGSSKEPTLDSKRLSIYSSSSSSSSDFGFKVDSLRANGRAMDKHPGARKLLKQKSSDSVVVGNNKSGSSVLPGQPPAYSSQSSTPQHKGFSSNKAAHSVPNLTHSSPLRSSFQAPPAFSPPGSIYGGGALHGLLPKSALPPQVPPTRGSNTQLEKVEERIQGRGMSRSSASYGIQSMLQNQIANDSLKLEAELARKELDMKTAISKLTQSYEDKIKALTEAHSHKIQELNDARHTSLINAKNVHETDLKHLSTTYEARIAEMKRVHKVELDHLKSEYDAKIKAQRNDFDKSIANYKDRDDAWQLEKQDVLSEIQRLKDEANRFIAILSQEDDRYEDEGRMSPAKKQTLQREIESLQLVIDMRTSEIHKLREEQTRHLQQLEEFEKTRNLLSKMQSKVEDLQAQLENKNELQRQLSLEKSKLENSYEEEAKKKARMSMQVEELQWRIRNHFELPPTKILSPSSENGGGLFLGYNDNDKNNNLNRSNGNSSVDSNGNSTPIRRVTPSKRPVIHSDNNSSARRPYSSPSPPSCGGEGGSGVSTGNNRISPTPRASPARPSTIRLDSTGSSLSPSPRAEEDLHEDEEILVIEKAEEDDEGLGDISSEASSPQPLGEKERSDPQEEANNNGVSGSGKNEERVPSRIPLSLETNL